MHVDLQRSSFPLFSTVPVSTSLSSLSKESGDILAAFSSKRGKGGKGGKGGSLTFLGSFPPKLLNPPMTERLMISCVKKMRGLSDEQKNETWAAAARQGIQDETLMHDLACANAAIELRAHIQNVLLKCIFFENGHLSQEEHYSLFARATATSGAGTAKQMKDIRPLDTKAICKATGLSIDSYPDASRAAQHYAMTVNGSPILDVTTVNKSSCGFAEGYGASAGALKSVGGLDRRARLEAWEVYMKKAAHAHAELCTLTRLYEVARKNGYEVHLVGGFETTHAGLRFKCKTDGSLSTNVQSFLLEVYTATLFYALPGEHTDTANRSDFTARCARVFSNRIRRATYELLQTDPLKSCTAAIAAGVVLSMVVTEPETQETMSRPAMRSHLADEHDHWKLMNFDDNTNDSNWAMEIDRAFKPAALLFEAQAERCCKAITSEELLAAVEAAQRRGPSEATMLLKRFTSLDVVLQSNAGRLGISELGTVGYSTMFTMRSDAATNQTLLNAERLGFDELGLVGDCAMVTMRSDAATNETLRNAKRLGIQHLRGCPPSILVTLRNGLFTTRTLANAKALGILRASIEWSNYGLIDTMRSDKFTKDTLRNMRRLNIPLVDAQWLTQVALVTLRSNSKVDNVLRGDVLDWVAGATVVGKKWHVRSRRTLWYKSAGGTARGVGGGGGGDGGGGNAPTATSHKHGNHSSPSVTAEIKQKKRKRGGAADIAEKSLIIESMAAGMKVSAVAGLTDVFRGEEGVKGVWKRACKASGNGNLRKQRVAAQELKR
jgi:hypothetical protein